MSKVSKELIEIYRKIVLPYVSNQLYKANFDGQGETDKTEFEQDFNEILNLAIKALKEERPQGKPVIKCQDCKYRVKVWREDKRMKEKGYWDYGCEHMGDIMGFWGFGGYDDEFCSDAEQKGDAE